jgi:3-hydroxyacyl-CoA dehydrogenase/enoyl-CoA hydratase/3-hydroxybutyryl-CoA epimerase
MNRHWRLETDNDGIGWLHFDHADSPLNILSDEALIEFGKELEKIERLTLNGLVILSDKENGFIAGADVKSFRNPVDAAQLEASIHKVHQLLLQLEMLPFPSLALIHGFCLGGGLELALACDYRLARDDAGTRLAFPEVRLGIFPGFGGTVRSIERLGPLPAMKLMLSGRSIDSRKARRIGLVDQIAPDRQLKSAARALLERHPASRRASLGQRLLNSAPARQLVAPLLRRETAKQIRPEHYPAPFALIEHWRRQGGNRTAMLASEATEVSRLLSGETAQNLIRVFFLQERLKSLAGASGFKPTHLHVVGGGIMGGDIAAWCALKGLRVTLQDRSPEDLIRAMGRAHQLFKRKLKSPYLLQAAVDRLMPDPKGYGVAKADLIIEAIFENLEAKQALFRELEANARPDTLLASNTSSIPLESIGEALKDPSRLIGLHFFNPVERMQLVEIVHGSDTPAEAIARGTAFARAIDRLPLPVKSSPGFLVNRILMPYLLEAVELVDEGIPAPLVDKAAMEFGMPMGPIELADRVGLDICLAVAEKLAPIYHFEIPGKLRSLVNQKQLGLKTGKGFYRFQNGKRVSAQKRGHYQLPNDLSDRMIYRLLNEAVACLREGVVEDADLLDAGVVFGTGFAPFRGGPMHFINSADRNQRRHRLQELEQQHGGQFHPDAGWSSLKPG